MLKTSPGVSLSSLRSEEAECTRCPLYRHATQVVPGEGAARARLMLVGEQPGNEEDLAGRPFVGPAGRILDRALDDAGIARRSVFVTNAVKHFKFEERGKRRLHKRPNAYEIERCKFWLDRELAIIRPTTIVTLGATAVRSVFGRPQAISDVRGQLHTIGDSAVVATIHPSFLLRQRDSATRREEYLKFVADLRRARKHAGDG